MKTMVTVAQVGDAIRVSKVTAHGEEIIEPDMEVQSLAILLWGKLMHGDPGGGSPLLPWHNITARLDKMGQSMDNLTTAINKHAHEMRDFQVKANAAVKPTPVPRGQ